MGLSSKDNTAPLFAMGILEDQTADTKADRRDARPEILSDRLGT